jgi:ABC-type Zn uptake system ZnuABC Zn-binding protein ZnuA
MSKRAKFIAFIVIITYSNLILKANNKIQVVTSASIFADMISNISGELADVHSIIPIGSDPHSYEPKPKDISLLLKADIIMLNGLGLEVWLMRVIKNLNIPEEKIVILTNGIKPLASEEYTNSYDPHAWMTANNGLTYIRNIYESLKGEMKNDNDKIMLSNQYLSYQKTLQEIDSTSQAKIAKIPTSQKKLVTAHDAFQYFGQHYGLALFALQGISPEADIRINDFQKIVKLIQINKIPAIFAESTINPKVMENIAQAANCTIGGKLYADSLSDIDGPAPDYISLIKHNVDAITEALILVKDRDESFFNLQESSSIFLFIVIFSIMVTSFAYLTIKL